MAQVILHWMDGWRLGGLHFDLTGSECSRDLFVIALQERRQKTLL
jgi:hypothetical protein